MKLKLMILFLLLSVLCYSQSNIKPYLIGNSFFYLNEDNEKVSDGFIFLYPVNGNIGAGKINDSTFVKITFNKKVQYDTVSHYEFFPTEEIEYQEKCNSPDEVFYDENIAPLHDFSYGNSSKINRPLKSLYKIDRFNLTEYRIFSNKMVCLDTITSTYSLEYLYDNYFLDTNKDGLYTIFEFGGDTLYTTNTTICWDNYNQILTKVIDKKVNFIDIKGNPLTKTLFNNYTKSIHSQYIIVMKNSKYGLLDKEFKGVFDCKYESIGEPLFNTLPVKINGKWKLFGLNGKRITNNKYDSIIQFSISELRLVSKDNKMFYIDNYGNELRKK